MSKFDNLSLIMNSLGERCIIIDKDGCIVFGNKAYQDYLRKHVPEDCFPIEGKNLLAIRPNAKLPQVLKTGMPLHNSLRFEVSEVPYIVNGYPIYENGELIGAVSTSIDLINAKELSAVIEKYDQESMEILKEIKRNSAARYSFDDIIAHTQKSKYVKELAEIAANSDITVLLESESGTGKEIYAQAIHNASSRKNEVFIPINCANFTETMLESELFGYVDGAFTGASKGGKAGLFEAANGGTIFLDEVSEIPLSLQSKLLRVLQEGTVRRIGSVKESPVDVRIIAACNANLEQCIKDQKFRKDLYFRLNVFKISIPPLRDRIEDIPYLVESELNRISLKMKKRIQISNDAIQLLLLHHWPGNVRELFNVLEFSSVIAADGLITSGILPFSRDTMTWQSYSDASAKPLAEQVREFEQREIERVISKYGTSVEGKKNAAKELGISLATLYKKLDK